MVSNILYPYFIGSIRNQQKYHSVPPEKNVESLATPLVAASPGDGPRIQWGYPNSWMVYNGKSIYKWTLQGYSYFTKTPYIYRVLQIPSIRRCKQTAQHNSKYSFRRCLELQGMASSKSGTYLSWMRLITEMIGGYSYVRKPLDGLHIKHIWHLAQPNAIIPIQAYVSKSV